MPINLMDKDKVTITFPNSALSIEADVNGTCLIVDTKPEFPENISTVIVDGMKYPHMKLIEPYAIDDRYWFSFIPVSKEEMLNETIANLEDVICELTGE